MTQISRSELKQLIKVLREAEDEFQMFDHACRSNWRMDSLRDDAAEKLEQAWEALENYIK